MSLIVRADEDNKSVPVLSDRKGWGMATVTMSCPKCKAEFEARTRGDADAGDMWEQCECGEWMSPTKAVDDGTLAVEPRTR